jgi:hypothetical protein
MVKKQFAERQSDAELEARLDDTGTIRRYLRLADQVLQDDDAEAGDSKPKSPAA